MARKSPEQKLQDLKRREQVIKQQLQQTESELRKRRERERARRYERMGSTLDSWGIGSPETIEFLLSELASTEYGRKTLEELGVTPTHKWPKCTDEETPDGSADERVSDEVQASAY